MLQRRFELNPFAFTLAPHVGEMFRFAGIDRQILRARVFADDHSRIDVFLWTDEEPAAFLNVVQRVGRLNPDSIDTITPRPRPPISPLNGAYSRKR